MPALTAFPAAALDPKMGVVTIIMSSIAALAVDAKFQYKGATPKWYIYMRVPLTAVAVGGLMVSLWGTRGGKRLPSDSSGSPAMMLARS